MVAPLITIKGMGGMRPRVAPDALAEHMAADATDCRLDGTVCPLVVSAAAIRKMNNGSAITPEIPASEVIALTKPNKITGTLAWICNPLEGTDWLSEIQAWIYQAYYNGTNALVQGAVKLTVSNTRVENYDGGVRLYLTLSGGSFTAAENVLNDFYGPRFYSKFVTDANSPDNGGPDLATSPTWLPAEPNATTGNKYTDPFLPGWSLPLKHNGRTYAELRVRDIAGDLWDKQGVAYTSTRGHYYYGGDYVIDFELAYLDPSFKTMRFVQTLIDDADHEGPPSDVSDLIEVGPGQKLALACTGTDAAADYRRIYMAGGDGGDDFLLTDEIAIAETSWAYTGQIPLPYKLPDLGAFTESGITDVTDFLASSVLHPAGFGAAVVNVGDRHEIWFSDVDRYSSWPGVSNPNYARPVSETILCMALVGQTIVVFTTSRVYATVGSAPDQMRLQLLSESAPLLNILGLCRLGDALAYASNDGIMATDGHSVKSLTDGYYTAEQFTALTPANMTLGEVDGALVIEGITPKLYFDPRAGDQALTKLTSTSQTTAPTWTSKTFHFDEPVILDYALIHSSDPVALTVYAIDDALGTTISPFPSAAANINKPLALGGLGPARTWKFKFALSTTTTSIKLISAAFFARRVVEVPQGGVNLTLDSPMMWENIWLKFPDQGRFVAGSVMTAGGETVRIKFGDRAFTAGATWTQDAADGRVFAITNAKNTARNLWRLRLSKAAEGEAPLLDPVVTLNLYTRQLDDGSGGISESADGVPAQMVKTYKFDGGAELACIAVQGTDYTGGGITLGVKADNSSSDLSPACAAITDGKWKGLPRAWGKHTRYNLALTPAAGLLESYTVLPRTIVEIGKGDIHVTGADPLRQWLHSRYVPPETMWITGGIVFCTGAPTLRLFANANATETPDRVSVGNTNGITVANATEFKLSTPLLINALDFDFYGADDTVSKVIFFTRKVMEIGEGGAPPLVEPEQRLGYTLRAKDKVELAAVRLTADSYTNAKLTAITADGASKEDIALATAAGRLSGVRGYGPAHEYKYDISVGGHVDMLEFFPRVTEILPAGQLTVIASDAAPCRWLLTRYRSKKGFTPRTVTVKTKAGTYPAAPSTPIAMRIWKNGETTTPAATVTITSGREIVLADLGTFEDLEFDFSGQDHLIASVMITERQVSKVGATGLVMRAAEGVDAWAERFIEFNQTGSFVALRIKAPAYVSMTARLYCEGVLQWRGTITSSTEVRLWKTDADGTELTGPQLLANGREWKLSIDHDTTIEEVALYARMDQDLRGGVARLTQGQEPNTWLGQRISAGSDFAFKALRVKAQPAGSSVTITIRRGGAVVFTRAVTSESPMRLPVMRAERTFDVDAVAAPAVQIEEVALATSMEYLR